MEVVTVQGVDLLLASPDEHETAWVDFNDYVLQLEAAWLRLSDVEPPLNPRIIGEPGLGKTTLACAVGRRMGRPVYIFQCTMDTRPEDLIITPVLVDEGRIEYRASGVVAAMIKGGMLLLDEGNRMPERSWASLAPLMDGRRYVESVVAGVKVKAHPEFRMCVTMNEDTSVFELPGYIQSRLKPKIEIVRPPWGLLERIVCLNCPGVDDELLQQIFHELRRRGDKGCNDSPRDMLNLASYAEKLRRAGVAEPLSQALAQTLSGE